MNNFAISKFNISLIVSLVICRTLFGQLPNTDIWIAYGQAETDSFRFYDPTTITDITGYDNQPVFSPDGKFVYFTAIRDGKQSDIYRHDLSTHLETQITNTTTSEYSPTFMKDGKNISVVMVEPDSSQRLWKFPKDGGKGRLLYPEFDSIGYHCWFYGKSAAVFLLTEPSSLQLISSAYEKPRFVDDSIGRCIRYHNGFLFYTKERNDGRHELFSFNLPGWHTRSMGTIMGTQDYALYEDKVFFAEGKKIYCSLIGTDKKWVVLDLSITHLNPAFKNISRMSISADGKELVFVVERE